MWTSFCQNDGRVVVLVCVAVAASSAVHPNLVADLFAVTAMILGISLTFGFAMGLKKDNENCEEKTEPETERSATYKSKTDIYKNAAVVTDSKITSDIGNDILLHHNGNAVDAAVAALLATGVVNCHSAGLGGGSVYVIYDKDHGWHAVNCRSTAPMAATEDMFLAEENRRKSLFGGMASGVPGELKGLYEVHKKFGKVPWKEIVRPTIRLCEDGVPLLKPVFIALGRLQSREDKTEFKEYFDHNHNILPVGTKVKLPQLAKTLYTIAENPLSFYNASLARDIVADINEKGYKFNPNSIATAEASSLTYHRIIEAMKFAYGKRTLLGDDSFVNIKADIDEMMSLEYGEKTRAKFTDNTTHEIDHYNPTFSFRNDHGTIHISVIDSQGNAVSVSSTINTYFGCRVRGKRTGIVFNSIMDDFSTSNTSNYFRLPASPANFIRPGKRPLSSMSPVIVWDRKAKKVKLVTGAAGGTKVATATAQAIIKGLEAKGHKFGLMQGMSIIQAALVLENGIVATADYRKDGQPSGF